MLQTRNLQLFNEAYQKYSRLIYGISLHILFDAQEAEDVVQECFMSFASEIDQVENPKFWLARAASNKSIDRYRKLKTAKNHALQSKSAETNAQFFTISTQSAISKELQKILESLEEDERALLVLKLGYDYQYDEISKLLGIPEGTVKSQVFRLLKKIQEAHGADHAR